MNTSDGKLVGRIILAGWLSIGHSGETHAQSITVAPASPRAHERIVLRVGPIAPLDDKLATVTMDGNKITIVQPVARLLGVPGTPPYLVGDYNYKTYVLGPLPQGVYDIEYVSAVSGSTSPPFSSGSTRLTVAAATVNRTAPYPLYDYSDLWWNEMEAGWGMSIHTKNDKLFAAWFVYDAAGKPNWYTFQAGSWTAANVYSGLVVKTTGPVHGGITTGNGTTVLIAQAGTATLTFNGYDKATFAGTVDGLPFNKTLTRQLF